jgi:hypothetical protein
MNNQPGNQTHYTGPYEEPRARRDRKRKAGRLIAIVFIGFVGLGVGWLAGKALSDTVPPAAGDNSATEVESAPARPPQPEVSQPQPPVVKPEPKEKPEKDEGGGIELPTDERSMKEAGRKALKRVLKEIEDRIDGGKRKDKKEKKERRE